MGRKGRKRRPAVMVVEEEEQVEAEGQGNRAQAKRDVAKPQVYQAQKRRKPSHATVPAAAAAAGDGRQLESVQTLDDARLAPCFGVVMRSLGLERPTPVQSRCWPVCIARHDAVVIAPTGSGKTLGYILPAVAVCLSSDEEEPKCRPRASPLAVVICPTRELAQQVHRVCRPIAKLYKLHAVCATGGVDKAKQTEELRKEAGPTGSLQLLIGTPGRLHDLLGGLSREEREQQLHEEWELRQQKTAQHDAQSINDDQSAGHDTQGLSIEPIARTHGDQLEVQDVVLPDTAVLSFAHVRVLILDEMDKLLCMGNNYELQTIRLACAVSTTKSAENSTSISIGACKRRKVQVLLFSATTPAVLEDAMAHWVTDPVRVSVHSSTTPAATHEKTAVAPLSIDAGDNRLSVDEASTSVTERGQERRQNEKGPALAVATSITQVVHVCGAYAPCKARAMHGCCKWRNVTKAIVSLTLHCGLHVLPPRFRHVPACVRSAEHKKPKKLLTFVGKIRAEEKKNGARSKARILIFCNRIKTVKFVESLLRKNNHFCKQMSSAMNQAQRERTLNEFRCGKLPILVATDVAGRGLDVRGLEHVVNYDFPSRLEAYVHRVGRTGRQGADGHAYSFFGRHLDALAQELIDILESNAQWVDPNLRALCAAPTAAHDKRPGSSAAEDEEFHSSDGLEQWSDSDD